MLPRGSGGPGWATLAVERRPRPAGIDRCTDERADGGARDRPARRRIRAVTVGELEVHGTTDPPGRLRPGTGRGCSSAKPPGSGRSSATASACSSTSGRRPCPGSPPSRSSTWSSPSRTRRDEPAYVPDMEAAGYVAPDPRAGLVRAPRVQGPRHEHQPAHLHGRLCRRSTGCSASATGCGPTTTSATCTSAPSGSSPRASGGTSSTTPTPRPRSSRRSSREPRPAARHMMSA